MRYYQRGIATSIIVIIFLIAGVAIASGYFIFYQNQLKQKSINSFEDCAKYYPVMESYPGQCNTPDGRHFVQQLSDEKKKKLIPPTDISTDSGKICAQVITLAKDPETGECKEFPTPCEVPEGWEKVGSCDNDSVDETANWETFAVEKFSFKFPKSMYIQRKEQNEVVWKMNYTPGTFTYNAMIFKSQNRPFSKLQVGDSYSIYIKGEDSSEQVKSKITNIDESQEISLGGKKAFRSTFGCGVGCYFHVLYFEYESKYYELLFNGAGGGLIKIFDQIITTFKFLE